MPFTLLPKAAGYSARFAVAACVCFASFTLAACGGGSNSASAGERVDAGPPGAGPGANDAPVISGKPLPTAVVNIPYAFRPEVHDPDGDVLVFEVTRKPEWAAFDPATGELSGTPPAGTTGTYSDIVIYASDGELKSALPAFSIKVTESPATGSKSSVTLSWSAPTQNTDGSPLSDLAGYRVHYGTASNALDQRVDIGDPGTTRAVIPNLAPGTWHFAISAYTMDGTQSATSDTVSKVVN